MILHDISNLSLQEELSFIAHDKNVIAATDYQHCLGCLNCWVNNPGECIIKDQFQDLGKRMVSANHVYVISRISYGGFSPSVKGALERVIPNALPSFTVRKNRFYHSPRYKKPIPVSFILYGAETEEEKRLVKKIAKAMCQNLYMSLSHSAFCREENVLQTLEKLIMRERNGSL